MSFTREIVTLQLGNYSNYVGTHWWNLQEFSFSYSPEDIDKNRDVNHDVLYREGVDWKGNTTFTPRLLAVDLKGALQHLPEEGTLYNSNEPQFGHSSAESGDDLFNATKSMIPWSIQDIEVQQSDTIKKPEFQEDLDKQAPTSSLDKKNYNLKENTNTWTDFLYPRFHPRSINIINEFKLSETENPFDTFSLGAHMWKTDSFEDEFSDKIRQYVEECNNCQGFQIMYDCNDGFSGLFKECLEHVSDEYSKTVFTIPLFSPKPKLFKNSDDAMSASIRVMNTALSYSTSIEHSSLIVPLSVMTRDWRTMQQSIKFPYYDYDPENYYESSAVIASFLDTISLRYRLRDSIDSGNLSGFCTDLNNYGRKLACGSLGMPFEMKSDEDFIECLDAVDKPLFNSLSPNCDAGTDRVIQTVSIRGIPRDRLKRPYQDAKKQMQMAAYRCDSVSQMLQLYYQCNYYNSMSHVVSIESGLNVRTPFPISCFNSNLNEHGFKTLQARDTDKDVNSIPIISAVQSSSKIADTIESLHRAAMRIKIDRLPRFKASGLEADDVKEYLENLQQFQDNYDESSLI